MPRPRGKIVTTAKGKTAATSVGPHRTGREIDERVLTRGGMRCANPEAFHRKTACQRSDDADGGGPLDRRGAGGDAQLHVGATEMGLDGVEGQVELGGHVGVGQELGKRFEHS